MNIFIGVLFSFSIVVHFETALAKDLDNLNSTTHFPNQISKITGIEVQWYCESIATGDKYYAAFSKNLTLTFAAYDPSDPELPSQSLNDPALAFSSTGNATSYTVSGDGFYYFNIVIDSEGNYGSTKSIGPFIIDTTAPSPVSVTGLSNTETNSIELTLESADATEYCILKNSTNIGACSWELLPENRKTTSPALDEGLNRIYAFFRDAAENMNQDFHDVTYTVSAEKQNDNDVLVPTLNEWGMIILLGILMFFALRNIQLNETKSYYGAIK
ncbi:MAG: hypothetical protein HQK75_06290 [Candidatus Magnetomorum sp.]|nr:hypothetical protein [Candidatus Magnetomorum sp.]